VPGRLLPLRVYYLTSFAAFGAYLPFFPRWLEGRGVQGLSMGLVAGLLPAMGVLAPPAFGLLSDVLGLRGRLLRIACLGACLSMGALAAGARAGALSFPSIFALMFVYAVFRAPMTMLADVVAMERARAAGTTYGEIRLWGSLGFLVAALVMGRLLDPREGAPLPAVIAALLLVALIAAFPLPAKPAATGLPVAREARALLAAPSFAVFLVIALLAQVAHAGYDLCFSLHLRDLGASDGTTGAAWAAGVVFEVVLMRFAEPLAARFTPPRLLVLALFGAAGRWALIATVPSLPVLLLFQPLHAVSFALWWVASLAYVKARAPAHALAAAQGLYVAAVGAGSVVAMPAWGAVYRGAGGPAVFGAAAAVALVAAILASSWAARFPPSAGVPRFPPSAGVPRFPPSAGVPASKTFAPPAATG
jgi:PPP family 3-phenylpropionic acid transporter